MKRKSDDMPIKEYCTCSNPIRGQQKLESGEVFAEMCLACLRLLSVKCSQCKEWIHSAVMRDHLAKDHKKPRAPKAKREALTPSEKYLEARK